MWHKSVIISLIHIEIGVHHFTLQWACHICIIKSKRFLATIDNSSVLFFREWREEKFVFIKTAIFYYIIAYHIVVILIRRSNVFVDKFRHPAVSVIKGGEAC